MNTELLRKNNIRVIGQGERILLFVHGFGCDQRMWRRVTPAFEKVNTVVLMDLVGLGNSDLQAYHDPKYDTLHGHAQDIVTLCQAHGWRNVTLIGHSVGGTIIALAAIQQPDLFRELVMICPSPCFLNENGYKGGFSREDIEGLLSACEDNYLDWSRMLAPVVMSNADQPELTEELAERFCANQPDIARHFARVTFMADHRSDLGRIGIPTLIVQTSPDALVPREVGAFMADRIPSNTLKVLDASGHCPHMSAPEEVIESIQEFIR
jgi:sigma-B regulation protein RsbQ